ATPFFHDHPAYPGRIDGVTDAAAEVLAYYKPGRQNPDFAAIRSNPLLYSRSDEPPPPPERIDTPRRTASTTNAPPPPLPVTGSGTDSRSRADTGAPAGSGLGGPAGLKAALDAKADRDAQRQAADQPARSAHPPAQQTRAPPRGEPTSSE